MKKALLFIAILTLGYSTLLLTSCSTKKDAIPALLGSKKVQGPAEEQATIASAYGKAVDALKKDPEDLKQYITLASAFISEGRITGDNTYYSNAAMQMLNCIAAATNADKDLQFQALSLKSAVLLNMHQFKEALEVAEEGRAMNSYNAGIFGALVDANVELGNYDEAVKDCDKMISIRPDLRSYSRASYLRQIFGQNQGAIEAMRMAVEGGLPGAENTEWARTKLADLYLDNGNADSASILYRTSLVYRPAYPYANIGLARVEKSRKNYDGAIAYTKAAIQTLSEAPFVSLLADLYELKGDASKAKDTRAAVVRLLEQSLKDEPKDALVKHNANRELATACMNAGLLDKALTYATTDINMRPNNIDANELAAWIYYLRGDYSAARAHADKMLATKTRSANTLYKAGVIYAAAGDASRAATLMHDALAINPVIDPLIASHCKPTLALTQK